MIRKYILPALAGLGAIFAVFTVVHGSRPQAPAPPVVPPSQAPYQSYVAGAGLVEASTENIAVGTNVAGVVSDVLVKVGEQVKSGQPLFKIDDRSLAAELLVRQANVTAAKVNVTVQQATVDDLRNQWEKVSSINDDRAVSKEEKDKRKFALQVGEARLAQARADVQTAEAQVKSINIEVERLTVTAPVDGELLQVKIRKGEFAPAGVLTQPLILIGNTATLHVRVDIDENDAWRVNTHRPAAASLRGNGRVKTDLQFVGIEPFVIPKRSLTGDSTERVDTRVLQMLYSFQRSDKLPVYVGQQMDVFIEAPAVNSAGALKGMNP